MKIGIDARVLMDKYYSGVSQYTANLLSAIFSEDKQNNYKLFYNSYHNLTAKLSPWSNENSQLVAWRVPNKIFNYLLQKIFSYPKLDRVLGRVDLFWSPHFNFSSMSPSSPDFKKIITVHDLSFLRYPEFFSIRKNFWHRALNVKKTLRSVDMIVAVSENTKNDLLELVGIEPEKIKVIYPGNNIIKREIGLEERAAFFRKHHLEEFISEGAKSIPFILYLGNIEPRKNIAGLIAAYEKFRADDGKKENKFKNVKLLLAGGAGWKNRRIYSAWQKSPYKDDIKFLGYVSQTEKEILYGSAAIFAYPSYYEGFGFPPLEAITYGVPVVCSNVSSLPEVVGEAAITVNPFEIAEIADAFKIILSEEALRERLSSAGRERAKFFSWSKAAREYLELFKKINEKE